MKRISIPSILSCLVLVVSCNQQDKDSTSPKPVLDEDAPAVEILSEYTLLLYDRPIDEQTDAEFIDSDIRRAMKSSRFYLSREEAATRAGIHKIDTLKYSEQIPFCADVEEVTRIYRNGYSESYQTTDLNPETNPLLSFHESDLDLTHCVARIEMKDGKASTYNNRGELLSEKPIEMPDYTEYLAELTRCQEEAEAETRTGSVRRDINWLRDRMASQHSTRNSSEAAYSIYEKNGLVVLEQYANETRSRNGLTVRTFLSSDISKNYGYEQLDGGYLKVRCTHSFEPSSAATTRSMYSTTDGLSQENPIRTIVETISILHDGTPMIRVSDKAYRINTIQYNL